CCILLCRKLLCLKAPIGGYVLSRCKLCFERTRRASLHGRAPDAPGDGKRTSSVKRQPMGFACGRTCAGCLQDYVSACRDIGGVPSGVPPPVGVSESTPFVMTLLSTAP